MVPPRVLYPSEHRAQQGQLTSALFSTDPKGSRGFHQGGKNVSKNVMTDKDRGDPSIFIGCRRQGDVKQRRRQTTVGGGVMMETSLEGWGQHREGSEAGRSVWRCHGDAGGGWEPGVILKSGCVQKG